jgi:hypothetical protein
MTSPGPRDSVVKVRPTHEVANAISKATAVWGRGNTEVMATAVLTRLRELGAFNIEFLEAIKRENME